MKKALWIISFLLYVGIISGQELKPLPDCKDMKEQIMAIKQSFDKLLTYKNKEIERTEGHTRYSTNYKFCDTTGLVRDERGPDSCVYCHRITLSFGFGSKAYKTDPDGMWAWQQKLLGVLKEVFDKWEYDEDSEEHKTLLYFTFTDPENSVSKLRKMVEVKATHMPDYVGFTLSFITNVEK